MDKKAKRKRFNVDVWTLTAIIVSFCALAVSIYESVIMSNQQYAAVWPYLEPSVEYDNKGFKFKIKNKGTGPAIIKDIELVLDGNELSPSVEFIEKLLDEKRFHSLSISSVRNSVLAIGEEITVMSAILPDSLQIKSIDFSQRASVSMCFCSIFKDCWLYTDGEVEEARQCKN